MSSPIWLITGCSSGFGLSLTLLALRSGHKVIATSRNPSKTPKLVSQVEALGGVWHQLDVCNPEHELEEVLRKARSVYGTINILVNSAAYALLGAFESIRYLTPSFTRSLLVGSRSNIDFDIDANKLKATPKPTRKWKLTSSVL
jgi:NAD(P)-dependent dehydrogenase (short-subunit alcohol dehydrogenase family)